MHVHLTVCLVSLCLSFSLLFVSSVSLIPCHIIFLSCVSVYVCLPMYVSLPLSFFPCLSLHVFHSYVYLSVCLPVYLFLSVCLSNYPSARLSASLKFCQFFSIVRKFCLNACPSARLSSMCLTLCLSLSCFYILSLSFSYHIILLSMSLRACQSPSVYISLSLFPCLSLCVCNSSDSLSVCLSVCLPIYLSLSICLSNYLPNCLSNSQLAHVPLSVFPSVLCFLFLFLFIWLFLFLS